MAVPPAPVWVPSQRSLAPSVTSVTSNDKDDNKMIPWAVHSSPGICLRAEEKELGDRLMKAMRPAIASNGVPCLQMRSVGSHSSSGLEKEGKDRANFVFM